MLNAVEALRIGSHRIQPTVPVVSPAHPHKKSLKRRKIRNRSCDVYDILELEILCSCNAEKLPFENLYARPVL